MMKEPDPWQRPGGITALSIFFGAGAGISLASAVAFLGSAGVRSFFRARRAAAARRSPPDRSDP